MKDNCRTFTNSVLILNGNHDTSVTPQDAIDFYQQTGAKDKSLRIYAGVTLFPGTPLLEEAQRGEFTPLTERELMQELLTFLELLTCDCELNTHHTSSMNLTGPDFLKRKPQILEALRYGIEHFDMDELANIRQNKRTL